MASGSHPTRIDQFFVSKKKRTLSPGTTPERAAKDAKSIKEVSPSGKCSLDVYLVNSQDGNSSNRPALVKRNLTLEIGLSTTTTTITNPMPQALPPKQGLGREIGLSTKCENKDPSLPTEDEGEEPFSSNEANCRISRPSRAVLREGKEVETSGVDVGGGDQSRGSVLGRGAENSELEQFAADFLSLYCSDLPSGSLLEQKVNEHKRHGSSSMYNINDKLAKRRHCATDLEQSAFDDEMTFRRKNIDLLPLGVVADPTETDSSFKRVEAGQQITDGQACLRKCNQTMATVLSTPASHRTSVALETPKSTRGSSIVSPGETFWNEAIQVVDGFLAENGNQAVENVNTEKIQEKSSINLRKESPVDKLTETIADADSCIRPTEVDDSLQLPVVQGKYLDKQASPLPVKHFNFSSEDKNLKDRTPCSLYVDNKEAYATSNVGQSKFSSTNHGDPQSQDIIEPQLGRGCGELHKASAEDFHPEGKKSGVNLLSQYNNRVAAYSPHQENGNAIINGVSGGVSSPSSSMALENRLGLGNWLPPVICNVYKKKGITKLYPWQVDCLQVDGVLQKRNLVYCASTSAGKSFVAEILMLRRVIETGKMALLVLPYVSICAEKAEHLEVLLEPLGKHVRSYYGNQGGGTLPKDTSVAVCTIEKANSLVNRLLEEDRLSEVGIIVIDELHMVADPSRGYLLELMLTKLRYAAGEGTGASSSGESSGSSSGKADVAHGLQIVGMSATMPNVSAVADWLHAALYQTEFRPVPLEEYIKVGNTIYNKKMEIVRTLARSADLGGKDPDHVVELCNEVVQDGNSVLLFCSSRKGCESTARHVAKYLKEFSAKVQDEQSEFADIHSAIDALRRSPVGLDPVLEETLPSGVAFHHAGLTVEEREIVETCYRKGLIRVLTATSTLAAGVNLPARRVIFRQPRIGRDFIDGTRYRQMSGRAGRTGIDAKGESVLICRADEVKRIKGLLNDSCPPLQSCLSEDKNGMTHAILEVVASGIVQSANDINRYVRCTLLNSTKPFQDVVKSAQDSLRWLCHRKFLEWNEDTKLYSTTPLGRAAFGSSLSPEESLIVLDDLVRAREGFVLASDLHLVYLVTPINVEVEPDWELYYESFMELSALDQSVGNRVGVVEPFLMRMAHGAPLRSASRSRDSSRVLYGQIDSRFRATNSKMLSDEQSLRVSKRFYVSLILSRLVQEVPVGEVCEAFKVARGMVQALQDNAGRFASMVSMFCERLGWFDLEVLVAKFQNRVSFGVRAEIVELTNIPYVKGSRARALYKAGLRSPEAIGEASTNEIAKALFESSSWAAQENLAQRRVHMGIAKKIKNAARKIVLGKAEEARVIAFSALKSLGLNVPQLSHPLTTPALVIPARNEASKTSSGGNNSSSSAVLENKEKNHLIDAREIENRNSGEVSADLDVAKSRKIIDSGLGTIEEHAVQTMPCASAAENSGAQIGVTPAGNCILGPKTMPSSSLGQGGNVTCVESINQGEKICKGNDNASGGKKVISNERAPINIGSPSGFDSFLDLWEAVTEFYFDIHFNKKSDTNSLFTFEVQGIAVCWQNSPVYYVNLSKVLLCAGRHKNISADQGSLLEVNVMLEEIDARWKKIDGIMGNCNVRKFTWNLKVQIQVLKNAVLSVQKGNSLSQMFNNTELDFVNGSFHRLFPINLQHGIDMCIVAWILWPDEERSSNPNLEKEVKKRLSSEAAALANQSGKWKNQMRRAAHNGCCRRVAQTRALCSVLWKLLVSEELVEALLSVEVPLVHVLADMEVWGIGLDMEGCIRARNVLSKKLRILEKEAHRLAGMTFSLNMPADIANVLYEHLKLPIPKGHNKGKQHASTDKHCLDLLRDEHPIIPVIKEHRTLAQLLNCTLGSICSLARLSISTHKYTLHGHWLQTSTATGRLSMEEPNLQCVAHTIDFRMNSDDEALNGSDAELYTINARDFFIPTEENWLLLAADYSQIELRLMAHFSKDPSLIELLCKQNVDAFTMIASGWTGKSESAVSSEERDQTKRLVYGILYGMGANSLSEQLSCGVDEAKMKIQSFKSSFPGLATWLKEAVAFCRQRGYVQTLKGRKRFLSKIKYGDSEEKSKAQRQAVNSICQGSAADIIKIAMVKIRSVIVGAVESNSSDSCAKRFSMLRGRCRILLQVHDELILEADPSVVKEAGTLLKMCMETAASLLVPLQVKLKVGRTWGSLEPFQDDG